MAAQQVEARDAHAVDIASLARQLREELRPTVDSSSVVQVDVSCPIVIAEVGSLTRNVDPSEYDPHHVAIGPYHWIRNRNLAKEDEKKRCLEAVLSAAGDGTTLEVYLEEMAGLEGRARSCYAHSFRQLDSSAFVRMLLLDGCYLLVRFGGARRGNGEPAANGHAEGAYNSNNDNHLPNGEPAANGHAEGASNDNNDSPTTTVAVAGGENNLENVAVVRDVFYLAENQIPFFVIDKIHQLTNSSIYAVDKIARYARLLNQQYSAATPTPALAEPAGPGNLLHLLHMHLEPKVVLASSPSPTGGHAIVGRWRRATEYHSAGVKFNSVSLQNDGPVCSILDVSVESGGGVLNIPLLSIDAETWRLLRNLIALEQRNPTAAGSHVTAYCVFMSQIACTAGDVELLARKRVIVHGLGNHEEVAEQFSDLCKGVVFSVDDADRNYLRAACQELEKRFCGRRGRWMALLRQKHCGSPWMVVGVAAAAIGLVCAVMQAVFSVFSYKH